jgi:hypothetical protein
MRMLKAVLIKRHGFESGKATVRGVKCLFPLII